MAKTGKRYAQFESKSYWLKMLLETCSLSMSGIVSLQLPFLMSKSIRVQLWRKCLTLSLSMTEKIVASSLPSHTDWGAITSTVSFFGMIIFCRMVRFLCGRIMRVLILDDLVGQDVSQYVILVELPVTARNT